MSRMAVTASRRDVLAVGLGAAAWVAVGPAHATPETRTEAIKAFVGEVEVKPGRVKLDIPPLVENGNSAPLSIAVESPMTKDDYVRRIGIFNEKNPEPHVLTAQLGPASGRATLSTRIRLADSQSITVIAEMSDGSCWSGSADVIVTLAACLEGS